MITIELADLTEALHVERALVARSHSLRNLAAECLRRAPEEPTIAEEYEAKATLLKGLADEIGSQAVRQARRDTVPLTDSDYLNLISQP